MNELIEAPMEGEFSKGQHPDLFYLTNLIGSLAAFAPDDGAEATYEQLLNIASDYERCVVSIDDKEVRVGLEKIASDMSLISPHSRGSVSRGTLNQTVGKLRVFIDSIIIHHKQALMAYGPDPVNIGVDLAQGNDRTVIANITREREEIVDIEIVDEGD
jgi:ferredoxin-fold anticodon binding domain-containing protein